MLKSTSRRVNYIEIKAFEGQNNDRRVQIRVSLGCKALPPLSYFKHLEKIQYKWQHIDSFSIIQDEGNIKCCSFPP
jgi:hypothetical protein